MIRVGKLEKREEKLFCLRLLVISGTSSSSSSGIYYRIVQTEKDLPSDVQSILMGSLRHGAHTGGAAAPLEPRAVRLSPDAARCKKQRLSTPVSTHADALCSDTFSCIMSHRRDDRKVMEARRMKLVHLPEARRGSRSSRRR